MIKKVIIKNNVIIVNKHHERGYDNKPGVIIIEKENGEKYILNLENDADISKCDYIDVIDTEKTEKEILFSNLILDNERLKTIGGIDDRK
jgi:hypothetical protein